MNYFHVNSLNDCHLFNKLYHNQNNQILMLFYMDRCFYCDNLKPKWEHMIHRMKKEKHSPNVHIFKINSKFLSSIDSPPVFQFPTIKLKDKVELKEYPGPHEEQQIKSWVDDFLEKEKKEKKEIIIGKTIKLPSKRHKKKKRIKSKSKKKIKHRQSSRTPKKRKSKSRKKTPIKEEFEEIIF